MTSEQEAAPKTDQAMIYLGGSKISFRCDYNDGRGPCGCNVFTKLTPTKYRCNSCGMVYIGERKGS
jgi:hypothetical protein